MKKFDSTCMETAYIWSKRSYCRRRKVGAVVANNGRVLSTGYNGTIPGQVNFCEVLIPASKSEDKEAEVITCPKCEGSGKRTYNNPYLEPEICDVCEGEGQVVPLDATCEFVVHAEMNALTQMLHYGLSSKDCDLYVTCAPCYNCAKLIAAAGIKRVVYAEEYKDSKPLEFLRRVGVEVEKYEGEVNIETAFSPKN